ncbi:MAG: hypothetical protein QS748_12500 [Candidatus Endonucleobacter bathymodioli]|uniref:Uncharacterized protein n=1 Tax=Candidatus Endonucleibacter bathymodioli TaxID=539814 RepID=A0AA90P2K5_9GAMM|nr:hypothetical protein [Candidatus Endonucleobacter bathymodioli]
MAGVEPTPIGEVLKKYQDLPQGGAAKPGVDSAGRMVDINLEAKAVFNLQELPDLSRKGIFSRNISLIGKMKILANIAVNRFTSWARGRPTKEQQSYLSALFYKATGSVLQDGKAGGIFDMTAKVPINTDDAAGLTMMVQFGLAEFLPSKEDQLAVRFKRPKNNKALENSAVELLSQSRKDRLKMEAHSFLTLKFPDVDEKDHINLAEGKMRSSAGDVIKSMTAEPVCLGDIFSLVSDFNSWLSIRYIFDGKTAVQAANEFDKIFDDVSIKKHFTGISSVPSFLLRAAPEMLKAELSDDANPKTKRVKASAPLLILWLANRLGKEVVQGERSEKEDVRERDDNEVGEIKKAIENLGDRGMELTQIKDHMDRQSVDENVKTTAEKVIQSLAADPFRLEMFFDQVADFNLWLSMRNMIDGKSGIQAGDVLNEFDKLFYDVSMLKTLVGKSSLDPLSLRAKAQVLDTKLSEDAGLKAKRIKDSAPLLISWLTDRLDSAEVQESVDKQVAKECSGEEIAEVKQAFAQLDASNVAKD